MKKTYNKTYGKNDYIRHAYKHTSATLGQAQEVINDFLSQMGLTLKHNDRVRLVGFGSLVNTKYKPRKGRNPQTGKQIQLPPHWTPSFHAGRTLKKLVNNK